MFTDRRVCPLWMQCYTALGSEGQGIPCLAGEVELIIRDIFLLEEVQVTSVTAVVCYRVVSSPGGLSRLYTIGVLFHGVGCPQRHPSVESLVHRLVSSEVRLESGNVLPKLTELLVKDVFEHDESCVYVERYVRDDVGKINSVLLYERPPLDGQFRFGSCWIAREDAKRPLVFRKRKREDDICQPDKRRCSSLNVSGFTLHGRYFF